MRLEDLQLGMRVRGVVAGETVHLIAVMAMGPDALHVIFVRSDGSVDQQILMRANEPQLIPVEERPTPFDADADDFKLAAEALRIRLEAASVDLPGGPFRALPHQLQAVYEQLLDQIPLRFLLADDPGAGKTIMAGLFLRELQLRGALERCLIVSPGGLVEQWQQELREKFGLEFTVLNQGEIQHVIAGGALFDRRSHIIVRMDQAARNQDLVSVFARTPWDVVVVDEAHRMSAHFGAGGEVKATKRYKLGLALRDATRHLLLMTATPHAGKEEDFQLFMRLLDPDRYEGRYRPDAHHAGAEGLMLRRTKEDLLTLEGRPLFPKRAAYTVPYELSPAEDDLYEAVTTYVKEEFDRADDLGRQERTNVGFALTVLQRRLASSPRAILRSLERRHDKLEAALDGSLETANGRAPARRTRKAPVELDAVAEEFPAGEREDVEEELAVGTTAARTPEELKREIVALTALVAKARAVQDDGTDRKWQELRRLLETAPEIRDDNGDVRKIIVFTEHRDTLDYLVERTRDLLGRRGVVASIHGGLGREQRLSVQKRFTTEPDCRVLIATDAAGEGLNLQVAHLMVNYDLPWNPNRLEQRFGRIHRIGQERMCHLWNLVADRTREGAVYKRLLEKLEEMKGALDGKVFDVLGEVFAGTPLHELLIAAVRHGDDPEVRSHLLTTIDDRVAEVARKLIEERALWPEVYRTVDHSPYQREVQHARARRLQPYYAEAFFRDAFARAGGRLVTREPGRFEIPFIPRAIRDFARGVQLPVRFPRVCFQPDLQEVDGLDPAELLGPGRGVLFDLVLHYTESTYGEALQRGTVLVDRHDSSTRSRLLAAIQGEIVDAAGNTVDKRFSFVEIDEQGGSRRGVARFLDYDAPERGERENVAELLRQEWLARASRTAEAWATGAQLPQWYATVNERRRRHVARARDLVTDRLRQEIAYWEEQAAKAESAAGADGAQKVRRAWGEVGRLQGGLERRLAELEAQEYTRVSPPRVLAVALVVPQGLLDTLSGKPTDDTYEVELRAMQAVNAAERALGRVPQVMEPNNPGFDITSLDEATGELVFIEVKGRIAGAETFFVTNHEIRHGQNAAPQYRLALVEVSPNGAAYDAVRYVADPFAELGVTALVKGIQFAWTKTWNRGRDPW